MFSQSRQSDKPFLPLSELGPHHPLTRRRVCPHPFWFRGGHTQGEGPNSDEGTKTVVL
jgi:hypothetical protein